MTRLADIARSLGGIELSTAPKNNANLHTFLLEFPVLQLLPVGIAQPHLEPPALIQQRNAPPSDPVMAGIHDTTFFARVQVQPKNPFAVVGAPNSHASVLAAIDAASTVMGTTTIQMVSYLDPASGGVHHLLRLRTQLQGAATPAQDFQLDDRQWNELLKQGNRASWLRLLSNIVRRTSDRAYYHVRDRLVNAYGFRVADSEEASWADLWTTQPSRNIKTLLLARLCPETSGAGIGLLDGGDGAMIVRPLACGHQSMIRKISLVALTAEACRTFGCPACGARVLQPDDDDELGLRNVCLRAQAFVDRYSAWVDLDEEETQEDRSISVPAVSVMCALSGALGSLKLPVLISPPDLSFIGLNETKLVFAEFEEAFGGGDWTVTGTILSLFQGLAGLAQTAIEKHYGPSGFSEDALPPGWQDNIERMLTRAMTLVSDRGCTIHDPRHAGLHKHDGDLYCGILEPEEYENTMEDDGTEGGGDHVTSMNELAELLGGTELDQ